MSFSDDFVARFEVWLTPDLETYLRAWAGMADELELYIADMFDEDTGEPTYEGWTILFDPDRCPAPALPYLAQYVGEILPVGIPEPQAREWIKDAPKQLRGTPYAIFRAAQRRLTGTRLVSMLERDGTVDTLQVVTYTDQTPNPNGTRQDLLDVVAADVILDYIVQAGQTYSAVKAGTATYDTLKAKYPTYAEMRGAQAGQVNFTRPRPI